MATTGNTAWVLKTSPFWISAMQWILRYSGILTSTIHQDRINNVTRDMPYLRRTARTLAVISAVTWIETTISPFIPVLSKTPFVLSSTIWFSRPSEVLLNGSSILWIVYLFRDLKSAGMIRQS
jgi:hypothetical protein